MPHLEGKKENSVRLEGRSIVYTAEQGSSDLLSGRNKGRKSSSESSQNGDNQQPQSILGPSIAFLVFVTIVYGLFYTMERINKR